MSLTDQSVVVIGGTSGIGLATARAAAEAGARVTVASSTTAKVEGALAELPQGVRGRATDVRDEADLQALFVEVGTVDHLVLSAGDALRGGGLADVDLADAAGLFDVRFWGALAAIKHALPHFSERGSIALTSGSVSVRPFPGGGLGSGLAAGVEGLARGLAVELAPLRVNALRFGFIATPMLADFPQEMQDAAAGATLTKRVGTPEEAARAHLYLMDNDYVTGTVLTVDGGGVLI